MRLTVKCYTTGAFTLLNENTLGMGCSSFDPRRHALFPLHIFVELPETLDPTTNQFRDMATFWKTRMRTRKVHYFGVAFQESTSEKFLQTRLSPKLSLHMFDVIKKKSREKISWAKPESESGIYDNTRWNISFQLVHQRNCVLGLLSVFSNRFRSVSLSALHLFNLWTNTEWT